MFVEMSEFNAISEDPDPTPRSAASDLETLLPISLLWDARHKWVKLVLPNNDFSKKTLYA